MSSPASGTGAAARPAATAPAAPAPPRTVYASLYRLANRVFFGLPVRDVDCACKLFRRTALDGVAVESGGAFFSAELLIKLRTRGCRVAEVGVPHYPRTA